mmetsp:Transcript_21508/g.62993  ORF Transcript_21508/g.62993 Transcript_21508/m.62993 type:complete len:90 (-) Transcript_21508:872-1141(-)
MAITETVAARIKSDRVEFNPERSRTERRPPGLARYCLCGRTCGWVQIHGEQRRDTQNEKKLVRAKKKDLHRQLPSTWLFCGSIHFSERY